MIENTFLFYQKSSFCPQHFSNLCTLLFSSFFLSWLLLVLWKKFNAKVQWHQYVFILDFWSWNLVNWYREYYIEKILMENLASPKVNFGQPYWHVNSLAYSMLFTALYFIWTKGLREPWNEVGSQSLAKHIIRDQT